MLGFAPPPRRRRPSLTPMIDVVFLLLVFFMLAARFGQTEGLPLELTGAGGAYEGPPRLVTVLPEAVLLNGIAVEDLPAALAPLMAGPGDIVVIRPRGGADVERLTGVLAGLRAAGLTTLAVLE
ncbi:biopolymer transporter ExbD [Aestuariicoccus sp. MJ-SS9]|uniref:ExbD/TolR family protein n=1 Tax=Aestuariicoccus sp. MJ-SS9 TaxID=3079855 RepID=UPI00290AB680|nr:biopolymer transporter ExbD [Aestuariicoccus sp. MJ-SS9]MDU8913695.1 biopolymer transporter ExbD [Aestuariicoccus sp. MJ-SS9]